MNSQHRPSLFALPLLLLALSALPRRGRNILNARGGRRAQPEDALAFFIAGHGKAHRGRFRYAPPFDALA